MKILPAEQSALWESLRGSKELGLVLYGGTAVGLRLGHRTSVDFDFFTDLPLDRSALNRALPFIARSLIIQEKQDSLTVQTATPVSLRPVKVQFFGGIDFGRVGKPEITSDQVIEVASLDDLIATKLKVLMQRVEVKDYQDLAATFERA